jgi:translocation and assembly module TamB
MRRAIRWTLGSFAVLAGLPLLAVVLALLAANTGPGREWMERTVAGMTDGKATLAGLSGRFPDGLRLARLELRDPDGVWLAIDNLALDWSPLRLSAKVAQIERLEAGRIAVNRLPPASAEAESGAGFALPVGVDLRRLHVARLDLGQAVAGRPAVLAIDGKATLASLQQGDIDLALRRLDGEGAYTLHGSLKDATVSAQLSVQEPAQGLIASFAKLQGLYALSAEATAAGPLSALQTRLTLALGPLQASLQGQLDLEHRSAAVTVNAHAPAMQLWPGLAWRAVALDAQVRGPFTKPAATGEVRIDDLNAADAAIRSLAMKAQGDAGEIHVRGELAGLRLPGPQPDLLASAPLALQASIRLDAPQRPVIFKLAHPLAAAEGKADTADGLRGELALNLPDLKPFAALAGLDVQGRTTLNLRMASQGDDTRLDVDGTLGVTGGVQPLVKLVGNAAKIGVSATLRGKDIALPRLLFEGQALTASAEGKLAGQAASFNWELSLKDLAAVIAGGSGQVAAQGQIAGPLDKFNVTAELKGEAAIREFPLGPLSAKLRLEGLPVAPSGQLTVRGALGGSPLDLALTTQVLADGGLQLAVDSARWKSAQAQGNLTLPKGADLPLGKIELAMAHLEDLRPLLRQPLAGSVAATLEMAMQGNRPLARLRLDARKAGLAGIAVAEQSTLSVTLADPVRHPVIGGYIDVGGVAAGTLSASTRMDLDGPLDALALRLSAAIQNVGGGEVRLNSALSLDGLARQATVTEWQADWKSETVRLLAPVRIAFADGLALDRLRLGLRQAELEVAGRISPILALSGTLQRFPAELASLFAPDWAATGTLHAEARLGGTPARPTGTLDVNAAGLQLQAGAGRSLPPVKLESTANLTGTAARIDARLSAGGNANLWIAGEVPFAAPEPFDLHAGGGVDLKLLDPLLTAAGRRLRGQITLQAGLAGTRSGPLATGSVQLANGEVQDFGIGAHLTHITALLQADGGTVRIGKLEGRAGPGTVSASGVIDLLGDGLPVNLTLAARKASPLAGDRLAVNLNADLAVRGQAQGQLAVTGAIRINRAEIRIPEHMPAKIAVLKVIRPGAPPPPPPAPGPDIALDLTMEAPREIFVRGRGLDSELGGKVRVRGTAAKPLPDGGFAMRRGQFTLAGQSLTFSKGEVGFDGGSLADPSLNFVANTSSGNVVATLAVGGTVSDPKIKLSSVPELPQDEVLARLLFGRSAASLSAMEMIQIASAVASLTGVASGFGDPLERVRNSLGLDRLSLGGASPALEAGRYVAPGVYVGAKQGVTGAGSQATVQIDIMKGLKLEGSAGTGAASSGASGASSTNSVGVIYQHEY